MLQVVPSPTRSERLRELHAERHSPQLKYWFDTTALFVFSGLALWAINAGWWLLALPAWMIAAHFALTKPLAFHEAAHGTLDKRRWLNEAMGHFIGSVLFVPLPVFRYAHSLHHARLATPADPELWPFTDTRVPRSLRVMLAAAEIIFGATCSPILLARSVLVAEKKLPAKLVRQIAACYAAYAVLWTSVLALVLRFGLRREFVILYVIPVALAGSYRTLQKYTEHLGLTGGGSLLALSRSVDSQATLGKAISYSLHHEHHHGAHHRYAKIPYRNLPEVTEMIYDGPAEETGPLFTSYAAAIWDMLPALADPKIGPQWNTAGESARIFELPAADAQRHSAAA